MRRPLGRSPWSSMVCWRVAFLILLCVRPSFAEERAPEPEAAGAEAPAPTLAYTTPAEPRPVRAAVELGAVLAAGFAWYVATRRDPAREGEHGYSWPVFGDKLTGRAFGPDTNHFGTNFIGHPLGGTGYYLAARSNRLSILESLGYSVAGSFIWELFGEVSEVVSLNDTFVTPLAGLAIGESTTQLASFLDRSAPTAANRVVASIVGAPKTLNDQLDGLEPRRAARGYPAGEWHRFEVVLEGAGVSESGRDGGVERVQPEARLEISSRLVRLPGFDRPGRGLMRFGDGNASRTRVRLAAAAGGLSHLEYAADVTLGGAYFRARSAKGGGNGYVGVSSGFVYSLRDYDRRTKGPLDRWSVIRPFGVTFEQRGLLGGVRVLTRADAGADFGGVRPLASSRDASSPAAPPILRHRGYYFGLGGHAESSVGVEAGPVETGADFTVEGLRGVGGPGEPVRLRLADVRSELRARVGYRVPATAAKLHAAVERRTRSGILARERAGVAELSVVVGVGAVF